PAELGNLSSLYKFKFENNPRQSIWRRRKQLTGGPAYGESLALWKARIRPKQETKPPTLDGDTKEEFAPAPPTYPSPAYLSRQQQTGESDEKQEEEAPVPLGSPNKRQEAVGERVRSREHASLSRQKAEEADRGSTAQLSSSSGLNSLVRENPEALEDIQRVIGSPVAGSFPPDDQLSDVERHRKLGMSLATSTALGENAVAAPETVVPEPDEEPGEDVDVAGGQALWQQLAISESAERFLGRSGDRGRR
ncbi:unnamed protein product, partial [Ectocarpus fasciculatus]